MQRSRVQRIMHENGIKVEIKIQTANYESRPERSGISESYQTSTVGIFRVKMILIN